MGVPEKRRGVEQTVAVERILAFLRDIMDRDPGSCIATYRAGSETVAVYGRAAHVADRIRPVSMDQGFTIVGVQELDLRTFRGEPQEIEASMRSRVGENVTLVNADEPARA